MTEKKQKAEPDAELAEPEPEQPTGRLSADELRTRLASLESPKPEVPVWAPPRPEDLVFAEVGPRFEAIDDVDRRRVGPGGRGYFHKELLARHPEGFRKVGADGKIVAPFPELRMNTRLITGPEVTPQEPIIPRPMEGAPAA